MKILHVTPEMNPDMGGVCQAVRTIIKGVEILGVHNEVVSLDSETASFLYGEPFIIHALGSGIGPWSYNSKLLPWLIDNSRKFDVVIVHGLWLYYGHALRKAIKQLKKLRINGGEPKVFLMPHGMLDPYFQRASSRRLKALRNYFYWILVENEHINEADGVLFTCKEECRLARETFSRYYPKREMISGLGVEEPPCYNYRMSNAFHEKCPQLQQSPFILFLSRIHEKKGVDLLIKAYIELHSKWEIAKKESKSNYFPKLVIAGPGIDTKYGREISRFVSDIPLLKDFILFTGMLQGDAKWGAFYESEVFVLPSHQENYGIAVVEAMACGKPVLISNKVNIWNEVQEGGGGFVEDDTLGGTIKLLEHWNCLNPDERTLMEQQAKKIYLKNFAVGPAASSLLAAISSVKLNVI